MRRHLTPARLRLAVQGAFAVFLAWTCLRFLAHVRWAMGLAEIFIPKPPAVEGFLPISALMAARRLFTTGSWDPVHPAGLTIFLAIVGMSFLWRKGFCGQLCPVGLVSNLLERLGRGLGLTWQPGQRARRIMNAPKYLLLAGFGWVALSLDAQEAEAFLRAPFNLVADTRMLLFFEHPSVTTLAALVVLAVLSVVVPAFWCRVLCPYGALLGLASWGSPSAITRDADACVSCGRCARACPVGLPVDQTLRVASPDCQGCAQCVGACPVPGCLGLRLAGRRMPWWSLAAGCLGVLLAASLLADWLGYWQSPVPPRMVRRMHLLMLGQPPDF
jgi:polyferredoxin